jgi:hypothetical protein
MAVHCLNCGKSFFFSGVSEERVCPGCGSHEADHLASASVISGASNDSSMSSSPRKTEPSETVKYLVNFDKQS